MLCLIWNLHYFAFRIVFIEYTWGFLVLFQLGTCLLQIKTFIDYKEGTWLALCLETKLSNLISSALVCQLFCLRINLQAGANKLQFRRQLDPKNRSPTQIYYMPISYCNLLLRPFGRIFTIHRLHNNKKELISIRPHKKLSKDCTDIWRAKRRSLIGMKKNTIIGGTTKKSSQVSSSSISALKTAATI